MTLKNIGSLVLTTSLLILQPGLILSITFLSLITFKKESYSLLIHVYNLNGRALRNLFFSRRKQVLGTLKYTIVFVVILNIFLFLVGASQGQDEKSRVYLIPVGAVKIKALTFSLAKNDNGTAKVFVSTSNGEKLEIDSSFNYDFFANDSPVYVRYGFYNLDLIPDLMIDTNNGDYFVSGLTGNLYKRESIAGMIED